MNIQEMKEQVCEWSIRAWKEGLFEGTCGNLSVYDREQGVVVITPSGLLYRYYTPEEMVVIDLKGNVIEGKHKPSSEWIMHTMVYEEKQHVNAVFHTHSPYASSFAVRSKPIPCILTEMIPAVGGEIPLAKFGMPGTADVGREACKVLDGKGGCLLERHGVLTVGPDLETAYTRAGYVENAAYICSIAMSNGPVEPIDEELYKAVEKHYGRYIIN